MEAANLVNFQNIFSLEGKVAVVSGGSRGLGLAAASGMLQQGLSKVYITSRTANACEEAVATLNALPNKRPNALAISVPGDSSTTEGIQALVDAVGQTTDHVDILLCNAGVLHREKFETHAEDKWDEVLNVNTKGVFYSVQKFFPLLTKRATLEDPSRVIIVSSTSGIALSVMGEYAQYSYAVAKAGAAHLGKQLAFDLGPRHILTNVIVPGYFPTDMGMPGINALGGPEELAKTYPNGRLGRGEDFAATVVWLASRAGSHVNGAQIVVDGGRVVGPVKPGVWSQ